MTFEEFVQALLKAGWVARSDAQYAHIRALWYDLCFRGLKISMPQAETDEDREVEAHETGGEGNDSRRSSLHFTHTANAGAEGRVPVPSDALLGEDGLLSPHTTDARVWAREFIAAAKRVPFIPADEDCMIGWFSNAIMAGWDERCRREEHKHNNGVTGVTTKLEEEDSERSDSEV